ncbi:hypothetical protein [Faecalibacterium sp. An58]|uniref:hypothetical protein n=1 Tax=Faecalibacterium sp. An58 TaxID=1965648 RepID=UPI001181EDFA|nr:hypothetical protein [Faecalibacterium sp. An58]
MKLKKIASLALAGIMAVSMLAGCKDGSSSSSSSSENTTPATGVSAEFASYLKDNKNVTFADDAEYQGYLSKILKNLDPKHDELDAVKTIDDKNNDFVPEVIDVLKNNVNGYVSNQAISYLNKTTTVSTKTDAVIASAYVAPGSMSQSVVLKAVADTLNGSICDAAFHDFSVDDTDDSIRYDYKYNGNVSIQKVTDGSSSAWYVLVVVEIDTTKVDA